MSITALLVAFGCGDDVPRQPVPPGGLAPHVEGNPQERIARIQEDSSLSAEEKERRINVVKQRNNLK